MITSTSNPRDRATLAELSCDLAVTAHRLRDLRRFTPATAREHLDAALANVAATLDCLQAEHDARTLASPEPAPRVLNRESNG